MDAKARNELSFPLFYQREYAQMLLYCLLLLRKYSGKKHEPDRADAEDIVADAFTVLLSVWDTFFPPYRACADGVDPENGEKQGLYLLKKPREIASHRGIAGLARKLRRQDRGTARTDRRRSRKGRAALHKVPCGGAGKAEQEAAAAV